jgi:DNA-binding MarR family transcriptional regulator
VTSDRDHVDEAVDQWRRERPDLDTEVLGLVGRLYSSVQLADVELAEGLAKRGLQPGWFDVLATLRRSGPPFELNPTELAEAMLVSSGGMTKRLDRLAEAGLVERRPDPSDRRAIRVRLTRRGKALVDRTLAEHLENQRRILGSLTPQQQRQLDRLLRRLLAGLENRPRARDAS